jgi:hypothetical protein
VEDFSGWYDRLKLVLIDETVDLPVYNREIIVFNMDDKKGRRIHQALCWLGGA